MQKNNFYHPKADYKSIIKKIKTENSVFTFFWIIFLGILFFRASYGLNIELSGRIFATVIFLGLILLFKNFNKKPLYLERNAAFFALAHVARDLLQTFDYRSCLNDPSMNAPMLAILEYKYGSAENYLKTVDYSFDTGFTYADYKKYFDDIQRNVLGKFIFYIEKMRTIDKRIIYSINYLKISPSTGTLSRIRSVFLYNIAQQLHTQNFPTNDSTFKSIFHSLKSNVPEGSPISQLLDALLLFEEHKDTRKINATLNKINPSDLIIAADCDDFEISSSPQIPNDLHKISKPINNANTQDAESNHSNQHEKQDCPTSFNNETKISFPIVIKENKARPSNYVSIFCQLNNRANSIIKLDNNIIKECSSEEYPIDDIIEGLPHASVKEGHTIYAKYSGDTHGGRTAYYARHGTNQVNLLDALTFSHTIEGAYCAFWFNLILPQNGVYWHGWYDSDYQFIENRKSLHRAIAQCGEQPNNIDICEKINQVGIGFFEKYDPEYIEISCLTFKPNVGIYISTVRLCEAGESHITRNATLIPSKVTVLY